MAAHIWRPRVTMGIKTGGLQRDTPVSSSFLKSDKQALRIRAKFFAVNGADLYYWNDVLQLQVWHITWFLFPCIQRVNDGGQGAGRLVVESVDKRQRIVSLTHDDCHFGVNRRNASKYYWPSAINIDVKSYVRLWHNYKDIIKTYTAMTNN